MATAIINKTYRNHTFKDLKIGEWFQFLMTTDFDKIHCKTEDMSYIYICSKGGGFVISTTRLDDLIVRCHVTATITTSD